MIVLEMFAMQAIHCYIWLRGEEAQHPSGANHFHQNQPKTLRQMSMAKIPVS